VSKKIFAVLYVSVMGLTRCYKTTVFLNLFLQRTSDDTDQPAIFQFLRIRSALQKFWTMDSLLAVV